MKKFEEIGEAIELIDKATALIYNIEGDIFQSIYERLDQILFELYSTMDIEDMPHSIWIDYRDRQIEKIEAAGRKLVPNPSCSTCDVDNEYVCFSCECDFINEGKELEA